MSANPLDGFAVKPEDLHTIGQGLQRPECILASRDGSLWTADARGGVVHIRPDGSQRLIAQQEDEHFTRASDDVSRYVQGTLPNGMAFAPNGDIVISNFGTDRLEIMTREGHSRVLADSIDGRPIGKVNFVLRDRRNRLWLTISTADTNWMQAMNPRVSDGYIALFEDGHLRVVADGFCFTNEIRLDANEEWLYVAETCARRVSRLKVADDGSLSQREIFGPSDHGGFIDGIAFDAYGNLWGTHVMADRVFALTPEGQLRTILDDPSDPVAYQTMMAAFDRGEVTPEQMLACCGKIAPWCASVTFGGPDLKTVYVGSLRGQTLPYFRSPVAGLPLAHWQD